MATTSGSGPDEAVFLFDPYYEADMQHNSDEERTVRGHGEAFIDEDGLLPSTLSVDKGKGVSKPVPIESASGASDFQDLLEMEPSGSAVSYQSSSATPSSMNSFSTSSPFYGEHFATLFASPMETTEGPSSITTSKGKARETESPPALPPLSFPNPNIAAQPFQWPSTSIAGPSGAFSSPMTATPAVSALEAADGETEYSQSTRRRHTVPGPLEPALPSDRPPTPMGRMKEKLGAKKELARKLLRKQTSSIFRMKDNNLVEQANASQPVNLPWLADAQTSQQLSFDDPSIFTFQYPGDISYLKIKGRSHSSPFPLATLDSLVIPTPTISLIAHLTERNSFNDVLPRELQLKILSWLINIHEYQHLQDVQSGAWTVALATSSKNKYVGRDRGMRELVKLSRVSKHWQNLVFDGELWQNLDLHSFPGLPQNLLLRLTELSRSFVTELDLSGNARLNHALSDVADHLSVSVSPANPLPHTQLTTVDLQGCSSVTTRSLHHLIAQSPLLRKLNVRGLSAVTNSTCDLLGMYAFQLTVLDVSQCKNVDAYGIQLLATSAISRKGHLALKVLRASGLKYVSDDAMASLGRAAPYLEVLDLSHARQLHNSAIEAFVAVDDESLTEEVLGTTVAVLNSREAGRDAGEMTKYRRRVTRLRHLSLSACILLTDAALAHLAHCAPELEFLELAGIGDHLNEEGIIHLLNTTPKIRRIDLEDATDISDALLAALTPALDEDDAFHEDGTAKAEDEQAVFTDSPGHALEHLVLSYAVDLSDEALRTLIRRCHRLRVLEVDNTSIGACILREFVQLSRKRGIERARMVAVDCRSVYEALVRELSPMTRPRAGWASYEARKLKYLDSRDEEFEHLKVGQDECDTKRVVLKSFYSWQTVDAVASAREKKKRATTRRVANESTASTVGEGSRVRWWSPGGRRSGRSTPSTPSDSSDGCMIM